MPQNSSFLNQCLPSNTPNLSGHGRHFLLKLSWFINASTSRKHALFWGEVKLRLCNVHKITQIHSLCTHSTAQRRRAPTGSNLINHTSMTTVSFWVHTTASLGYTYLLLRQTKREIWIFFNFNTQDTKYVSCI